MIERALSISEKALGPEHPDTADGLNNLANVYLDQGKYAQAEPLLKRMLAIAEKALGPQHSHVAAVLKDYARLLRETGRNEEGRQMEQRAREIRAGAPQE